MHESNPSCRSIIPAADAFAGGALSSVCWIAQPDRPAGGQVTLYRRVIELETATTLRLHVSGDQWFEFCVDGAVVLRGPSIGCPARWFFHTLELSWAAGRHELIARVFALPEAQRPNPVMSVAPGFLCSPDPEHPLFERLATGHASWQWLDCSDGWTFSERGILDPCKTVFGAVQQRLPAAGAWPLGAAAAEAAAWSSELTLRSVGEEERAGVRHLVPTAAPTSTGRGCAGLQLRNRSDAGADDPYCEESEDISAEWVDFIAGGTITVPGATRQRLLIDCNDYVLAFTHLDVQGAGRSVITMSWAERLLTALDQESPCHTMAVRSHIADLYCPGPRDVWIVEGLERQHLTTPWRRCGRYLQIIIETDADPVTLSALRIEDALPPSPFCAAFDSDDTLLGAILPICQRGLEVGLESTFCDTPYWEQVQWVGDMYPILLSHLAAGGANPVHPQTLALVADSIRGEQPTQACFPVTHGDSAIIPTFSLWYILMVHDYALWRGDESTVRPLMAALRHNLDCLTRDQDPRGWYRNPKVWNYVDWAPGWKNGEAPADDEQVSGVLNWLIVLAAHRLAALERWLGADEEAERREACARELAALCTRSLWHAERACYADAPGIACFSEHTQVLALLNPFVPRAHREAILTRLGQAMGDDFCDASHGLTPLKPFFSHHLLEALVQHGRSDLLFRRLQSWRHLVDLDLRTTPESIPGTRSDSHGWSAHPLFHAITGIAGIRPVSFGFTTVQIRPQPGPLHRFAVRLWTPSGALSASAERRGRRWQMDIELPTGLTGYFVAPDGTQRPLHGSEHVAWDDVAV